MPTVSEPTWWTDIEERRAKALIMYLDGEINDTVLRASLFAAGMRDQDLDAIVKLAQMELLEKQPKKVEPVNVLVLKRDRTSATLRFNNADSAANAVKLLRKQPDILFVTRVRHFNESVEYLPGLLDGSNDQFVSSMLRLL